MMQQYNHAILGGTFDHFHVGHEAMLRKAFGIAARVTIGITTEEMYQNKALADQIEPFEMRKSHVEQFLKANYWLERATILPIHDKYGNTLKDETIEAIVVSPETEPVARAIVPERQAKGLSKIEIILVSFVLADDGQPISSERIRQGLINRDGFSYLKFFTSKSSYVLPALLRPELQKPIGDVETDIDKVVSQVQNKLLITVGDIVTTTLLEANIKPNLALVDFRTRRQELEEDIIKLHFSRVDHDLTNPPGTINPDIVNVILGSVNDSSIDHKIVKVTGEEDLLTLPVVLLSPLNSMVIYGQYDLGMIVVQVTEEKKQLIKNLLEQF